MKKQIKKITLKTDKIVLLSKGHAHQVLGGRPTTQGTGCGYSVGCGGY